MLLKSDLVEDGDKVHHVRSYDFQKAIDETKTLSKVERTGDWWHVGHIPREMIAIWIKEAGLSWDDTDAVRDMVKRKLLSGEFNNLRPHQGTF